MTLTSRPSVPTASGRTANSTSGVDDLAAAFALVATRFAFRRPDDVNGYLRQHPHLVPILAEAATVIPRYFGADVPLVLEVFVDPEGDPADRDLFAIIRTPSGTDDVRDTLYRLQDEWWLAASPAGPGSLTIDIEPV